MLQLNDLVKLTKKRKRVGRGGSRGGTSGKGHKGQSARSGGGVNPRFEGGQMPLHRRLPKRGFTNSMFKKEFSLVTLDILQSHFQDGQVVTYEMLMGAGFVKRGSLIKLLATGTIEKKLTLEINACSKKAQEAIERVGGVVKLV